MVTWLRRSFRSAEGSSTISQFEPIYGLPISSLEQWLLRNPKLKESYDATMSARALRTQAPRPRSLKLI